MLRGAKFRAAETIWAWVLLVAVEGEANRYLPHIFELGAASGPHAAQLEPSIRKPDAQRILVVDDNTGRGRAARRVFSPDLAVLDIGLPVMGGYELGRRLRELPNLAGVRLVALTGCGQASDRQRTAEAGIQCHLVKPVQLAQLEAIIERREASGPAPLANGPRRARAGPV